MEEYQLDYRFGVSVDYWANSMQMFITMDDFISETGESTKGGVDS